MMYQQKLRRELAAALDPCSITIKSSFAAARTVGLPQRRRCQRHRRLSEGSCGLSVPRETHQETGEASVLAPMVSPISSVKPFSMSTALKMSLQFSDI
ncbi:Hypothetical predicted protein [Cloeon dipterum]|uniref:Uncharacterized protein n=1 Tax=Cloeon dipterum TaxID=197152 RepID=A0A8S1DYC7_9INSE|nr:Hypothetical predicted protein [Cloeon dipterum]